MATLDRGDPIRHGPQLHSWRTGKWLTEDDVTGPLVVFIHGFTSSSRFAESLASHVDRKFHAAVLDYRSHEGIERGASDLASRLKGLSGNLARTRFALVGHSMGGLVARQFARHADQSLRSALSGLATLCSPHAAAMGSRTPRARRRVISMMLGAARRDEPADPFITSLNCPAARQLLGEDPEAVIASLLKADASKPLDLPVLTISGGLNYIEFFKPGSLANRIANAIIQANLSRPNDGLVEESSADLTRCVNVRLPRVRHCNDYVAWSATNHTHVVENQDVGDFLIDWLQTEVFRERVE